jgi:hypothetical protein
VATTFRWAHASRDNGGRGVSGSYRTGRGKTTDRRAASVPPLPAPHLRGQLMIHEMLTCNDTPYAPTPLSSNCRQERPHLTLTRSPCHVLSANEGVTDGARTRDLL